MKVLNISSDDYANFAHDNAKALRAAGVDCVDWKTNPHVFNYPSERKLVRPSKIQDEAPNFDLVQIFHSDRSLLHLVKNSGSRLFVYHTGTRYRANPLVHNKHFNPHVERSFIALGEFEGLGSKNETYIVGAVDFDPDLVVDKVYQPYTIGHFPSNKEIKGTKDILETINKVKGSYLLNVDTSPEPYLKQLQRLSDCEIYIELFKPSLDGRKYGSFGITALEAASLGKVVITQNLSANVYRKHYGEPALFLCDTKEELSRRIEYLLNMETEEFKSLQIASRNWIQSNHSHQATGKRLRNLLKL